MTPAPGERGRWPRGPVRGTLWGWEGKAVTPKRSGRKPRPSSTPPTAALCVISQCQGDEQHPAGRLPGITAEHRLCRGGHRGHSLSCTHHHPARVGSRARMTPRRGRGGSAGSGLPTGRNIPTAVAAVGIFPAAGPQPRGGTLPQAPCTKPPPKGREGTEMGTHCSGRAPPAPPCPWTAPPASARGEERFPACKRPPRMLQSSPPSHPPKQPVPSSDLSGTQLGPSGSGSGGEREESPFKATPRGTGHCPTAGTHLCVEQLPPPPRRLRCGGKRDAPSDQPRARDPSLPRSTRHGHNSPARRSSRSPRLCW